MQLLIYAFIAAWREILAFSQIFLNLCASFLGIFAETVLILFVSYFLFALFLAFVYTVDFSFRRKLWPFGQV